MIEENSYSSLPPRPREASRPNVRFIFIATLVLLFFRLLAIFILPPDGDEVVHLHIADDIGHFVRFPVYFYQQEMMGPLESYFLAPFIRFFGFSFWGGRLAYGLFFLSFLGMFCTVVRRLFDRELAVYLFLLLSFLPFPILAFTTVVGYFEVLTLALLSLVLLLKMAGQIEGGWGSSLGLGVLSGLAFWCNPIFVVWLAAIGVGLIWLIPHSWPRKLPYGFLMGFLVGLFPLWIHGLQAGTLMTVKGHAGGDFARLQEVPEIFYLFFARLKYFLSTSSFGSVSPLIDELIRWLSLIPFVFFWFAFGTLIFSFVRSGKTATSQEKIFYSFVILPSLMLILLYSSRHLVAEDEGARFFLPLLIPYAFVLAWWVRQFRSNFLKKAVLALLFSVLSLGYVFSGREAFRKTSEFREAARFLEKENLHFGMADIGIAYGLNVLSGHQILATPVPYRAPYEPILKKVQQETPQFFILGRRDNRFRKKLEGDSNLTKMSLTDYDIFYGRSELLKHLVTLTDPSEE